MWTLLPYTTLFRSSDPVRLHRRVAVPPDRTAEVLDLFSGSAGTAHLAVLPDASPSPRGDLVMADVARESADDLIAELRRLGVARDGGITMEAVDAAVSTAAERAEARAPETAPTPSCGRRSCGPRTPTPRCRPPTWPS